MTIRAERDDTFRELKIRIEDENGTGFVKEGDIREIVYGSYAGFDSLKRKNVNTLRLKQLLETNNRIENSECRILNDGTLEISVVPLDPVARVFDREGSVYVNTHGKRVPANPSYHVDVPVVTTSGLADTTMVRKLLPVLRAVKANDNANALVSSLQVDERGDIIIVPNIVGHVINFGDTSLIENKLKRLQSFYRHVMPVRGWDAFDTISLKWAGRVVATKRNKDIPGRLNLNELDSIVDETLSDDVMSDDITMTN